MSRGLLSEIADDRRRKRAIVAAFVESVVAGDLDRIAFHLEAIDEDYIWRDAFQAIAKATAVPQNVQRAFMNLWVRNGHDVRGKVSDDRILIAGLKRLLPAYEGGPKTLYRGESAYNRRRRSYGLSWSSDEEAARSFAIGMSRTFAGGSVLLKTVVPPEAILCVPTLHDKTYEEFGYLVDRRKFGNVKVVERFAQDRREPPPRSSGWPRNRSRRNKPPPIPHGPHCHHRRGFDAVADPTRYADCAYDGH
jgi:hypothetical protein